MEDPLFTKILPDFRPIFCPIVAAFCKFFQSWEGFSPPRAPLSPTPMILIKFHRGTKDLRQKRRQGFSLRRSSSESKPSDSPWG